MTMETKVLEYHARRSSKPSPLSQHRSTHQACDSNARAHGKHRSIDEKKMSIHPPPPSTPRTPRREYLDSCPSESHSHQHGSMRKTRYKNKPGNNLKSPAIIQNIQSKSPCKISQSTSLSSKSVRTPSNVAYAGPTFHASPAPSSLPIPSFYSKSLPESPAIRNQVTSKDDQSTISPFARNSTGQSLSQSSPANVFYNADKYRKEKINISPPSTTAASSRPVLIPNVSRPSHNGNNNIGNMSNSKPSASAKLSMELEEEIDSNIPYGAAFSTPYSERIKAIRPEITSKSMSQSLSNQQRVDKAEALKAYLFSGHITASNSVV